MDCRGTPCVRLTTPVGYRGVAMNRFVALGNFHGAILWRDAMGQYLDDAMGQYHDNTVVKFRACRYTPCREAP